MTVYADILIILNFLVNYFMLLAVRRISRSRASRLRLALGALIGGVSSLILFLPYPSFVITVLKIISGAVMAFAAFGFQNAKAFLKNLFWLFAVCFLFGGLMLAVYLIFDKDVMIYTSGIVYFDVDFTFLIICTSAAYILFTLAAKLTEKKAPKKNEYYITVQKGAKSFSCTALMDSGNSLCEPFSMYPVILADKSVFKVFEREISEDSLRVVPVTTVSSETLIRAFRPDSLSIGEFVTDKVYVGESLTPLDEYKIILNINLEGEMQNV